MPNEGPPLPMLFLVGTDYDQPQLSCHTYQEAMHHATSTAQLSHVDVWSTSDGFSFERVARYRH